MKKLALIDPALIEFEPKMETWEKKMANITHAGGYHGLLAANDFKNDVFNGTKFRENLILDASSGGKLVNTFGGEDRVTANTTLQLRAFVHLGAGNDVAVVQPGAKIEINGGGDSDTLVIESDFRNFSIADLSPSGTSGFIVSTDGTEVKFDGFEYFRFDGNNGAITSAQELRQLLGG